MYYIALTCQTVSHWKTFCDVIGFPNVTFSDSTESVDLTNCQLKHVYYI